MLVLLSVSEEIIMNTKINGFGIFLSVDCRPLFHVFVRLFVHASVGVSLFSCQQLCVIRGKNSGIMKM